MRAAALLVALMTVVAAVPAPDSSNANDTCSGRTDDKHVGQPFADPAVCNQYFICGGDGKRYTSTCPAGTYYDTTLNNCSEAAKAACGERKV
ncbi:hypothetical protein H4R21_001055 [Coemansia helicoidea]|uniref:Uncharacterized protein n=1 Tax=Coemansia helicoidea TaxID=1286919 RepID=A0ACC1LDD6_9FUNG|nr:hypothetical protein H4R21_001055 [Coemansia helicoidea]